MTSDRKETQLTPNQAASFGLANGLAARQRVMTLGTCSKEGGWTAPVYYLWFNKAFYFFSSPDSRHIRDAMAGGLCVGASVFFDDSDPGAIKGLQMSGRIEAVADSRSAGLVAARYLARHGISLKGNNALDFLKQHFRAKLYLFLPLSVMYMDNSLGFGFREEVVL